MRKPKRIQRKRTKGWKMPEGAVYVGRPTKWGNPFKAGEFMSDVSYFADDSGESVVGQTMKLAEALGVHFDPYLESVVTPEGSLLLYKAHILTRWEYKKGFSPWELKGKDLACWCPLDQPCHADILLELANG